jgi:CRISPR system Cascade subunit CasA
MNVAFDPWIPVVDLSGAPKLASLADVFTDGSQYADLAVRPHERVALMRLFLCIAHAALGGPKDFKEWRQVPDALPQRAKRYLKKWHDRFELFDPTTPWLQIASLRAARGDKGTSGKTSPVAILDFEMATGNNSTLNDHMGVLDIRPMSSERLALCLLTFQNFAPGGGVPIAQWRGTKTKQVGNPDAPCISQSMIHCLIRGQSLAQTLHLNMPTIQVVKESYKAVSEAQSARKASGKDPIGKPVWEMFPSTPSPTSAEALNATGTYLGRLVPLSRWIRLIPGSYEMYCCNGFKYRTFKDGFVPEPTAAVRDVKKHDRRGGVIVERQLVRIDPTKALWRELAALLAKRTALGVGGPLAMSNLPDNAELDFHVCGVARDQASVDLATESVFHVKPSLRRNIAAYVAEIEGNRQLGIVGAEGYSQRLRAAIERYRLTVDHDWAPRVERTEPKLRRGLKNRLAQAGLLAYWTAIETTLPLLHQHIDAIETDEAEQTRAAWRKSTVRSVYDAYEIACGRGSPRQIRAFAEGLKMLNRKQAEPDSPTDEPKEDS